MSVRTRFAPSPTGELHPGNVRTAVLNWAFARHHGGAFILRLEDTDVERNVEASEAAIREALEWLGLHPDEDPFGGGPRGPYRQSERGDLYREHAERLLEAGRAFRCYCTPDELEAQREAALRAGEQPVYGGRCRDLSAAEEAELRDEGREPAIRFRVEPGPVRFTDRVRGEVVIDGGEFGDMVILRSDGRATYNFAVVVDDLLMAITHVIRGVGHLSNTPKQVLLYEALGARPPEFAHIPLVLAPGGERLSKRAGARGILEYRDAGYHPDAVVNYLSLLSWSSPTGDEVLTRERIVDEMDLDRLGSADAALDPEKMKWLSGQHIREEVPRALAARIEPFLREAGFELPERELVALAEVAGERIHLLTEAVEEARQVHTMPETGAPDPEVQRALHEEGAAEVLESVSETWSSLGDWSRIGLKEALGEARERSTAGGRAFYHPLRAALTGALQGPELADVAFLLGRDTTIERLRAGRRDHRESVDLESGR